MDNLEPQGTEPVITEPTATEPKGAEPKLINLENLTLEELKNLIEKNEGFNSWLSSEKDRHFSQSLNTWKQNNLSKEVENEISKRYPAESDEQKKLRELELKLQKMEEDGKKKELTTKALKTITEKKLDVELLDFVLDNDEESTLARVDRMQSLIDRIVSERVEEKYKTVGKTPSQSTGDAILSDYDKYKQTGDIKNMLKSKLGQK